MWFLWVILLIVVVTLYVSVGTMLSRYKPYGVATISALVGAIHTWILDTKTNFTEYILIPAFESGRVWDLYRIGAFVMTLGLIAVTIVAFFNAISSWSREEPFSLWK